MSHAGIDRKLHATTWNADDFEVRMHRSRGFAHGHRSSSQDRREAHLV